MDVGSELRIHGLPVGIVMYEKCLNGSGVYPLGDNMVVKAELTNGSRHMSRLAMEVVHMRSMDTLGVGPKVYHTGSLLVQGQIIIYIIMEKYAGDLGTLSDMEHLMSSVLLDQTVGWMINRLFRRVAYRARMVLTDLKPQNIMANVDILFTVSDNPVPHPVRISEVVLIDFGSEYCMSLSRDVLSITAYIAMLLLYSAISTSLGFHKCATIMTRYIRRQSPDDVRSTISWMDKQPVVLKSIQHFTKTRTATQLFGEWYSHETMTMS
jgi:hypothetical protein